MSAVRDQLKLFADMSDAIRTITLSGEQLGCFMRRLAEDLNGVLETITGRGSKANKAHVRPFTLKQIITTLSGMEPIQGSDLNKITYELRRFADINEDMKWASTAWEKVLTQDGAEAITTLEGQLIQFDPRRAFPEPEWGGNKPPLLPFRPALQSPP